MSVETTLGVYIVLGIILTFIIGACITKIIKEAFIERFFCWFWSFSEMRWMVAICVAIYFAHFFFTSMN
jgi:hypothetical protein